MHDLLDERNLPRDDASAEQPTARPLDYAPPTIYVIGEARDLLRGSGRHKNDDTGSRGLTVG